jgi:mRNA interferase MazF
MTHREVNAVPFQAGDVLLADLDPVAGDEQGGRRPVLVLSGPSYNELRNEQLIVAAITSRQRGLPFHVPVGTEGGLHASSWVQSESVRAISVERVVKKLGHARSETVTEVRNRVSNFLRDW